MEARLVRVCGHAMGYTETGSGPPVVLLHSGGLSSRQWGRLVEQLAGRHRVLAPDFLGYGQSGPWPAHEEFHYVLDLLAVEALLDEVGEPVALVGHSYGGFIGLLAALHRPHHVRVVAAYEPVSFSVLHSAQDAAGLESFVTAGVDKVLTATGGGGEEQWLEAFVDYWNEPGAWKRLSESARASFRAVGWKLYGEVRSLLADRTPHQAYGLVSAPTLLMTGETSPIAARRVAAILAGVMPRARLEAVRGAGHMGPLTHAPLVNRWVAEHVAP